MQISLTVTAGPHRGKVFSFGEHQTFLVGRSRQAHFRLPFKDKYFSRIHFMIEVNPPLCRLMDLESTNGTYVNGQKVAVADLKDGDVIKGGKTVIQVSVQGAPPALVEPVEPIPALVQPHAATVVAPIATVLPAPLPPEPPEPELLEPLPEACLVCLAPVPIFARPASARLPVLCSACETQIRHQMQTIPGYRLVKQLGQGTMGVVYLAIRDSTADLVALKSVLPAVASTPMSMQRFLREANILRELDHPNIVRFLEMGESEGHLWFAMEYVRGIDAASMLRQQGPLPIPEAVAMVSQLLDALAYAHAMGFVHRDIKPANLLVRGTDWRSLTVKLADFGLARVYQASHLSGLTITGEMGGTLAFMAPEQITDYAHAQPTADQYSAAATLYNLMTDRFVYDQQKNVPQQILKVMQDEPVPIQQRRADVPDRLAAVIHRALSREPEERFPDANAMQEALQEFTRV